MRAPENIGILGHFFIWKWVTKAFSSKVKSPKAFFCRAKRRRFRFSLSSKIAQHHPFTPSCDAIKAMLWFYFLPSSDVTAPFKQEQSCNSNNDVCIFALIWLPDILEHFRIQSIFTFGYPLFRRKKIGHQPHMDTFFCWRPTRPFANLALVLRNWRNLSSWFFII